MPAFVTRSSVLLARELNDKSQLAADELWADRADDPTLTTDHDLFADHERLVAAQVAGRYDDVAAAKLVEVGDHRLLNGDSREHDPWFRAAAPAQYLAVIESPSKPQRRLRSCPGFSARPLRHEGGRT